MTECYFQEILDSLKQPLEESRKNEIELVLRCAGAPKNELTVAVAELVIAAIEALSTEGLISGNPWIPAGEGFNGLAGLIGDDVGSDDNEAQSAADCWAHEARGRVASKLRQRVERVMERWEEEK